jgi:EmrB/QacA subfamily drug resistance transporter
VERDGDGRGLRGGPGAGPQPLIRPTPRQKRLTLVACILASSIVFVDSTVVNVALPAIREDLDAGLSTQQWVVEAYLVTLASLVLIGGSLSDLFGRRRVFEAGVIAFGVTSLLTAAAPSSELLVAARALQGVAGALLVPSALAMIMATFEEDERAAAIGSWTAWSGVATLGGPLLGGLLVEAASWRLVFAIGLVPILVTLYLLVRHVPRTIDVPTGRHIDLLGAVLCALGLSGVVLALIEQPHEGWGHPLVLVPLTGGVALLALFLRHERRSPDPMLPLGLFRRRNFAAGNAATLAIYAGLSTCFFFLPIFLQGPAEFTAVEAGMALVPMTVMLFLLSKRFGALADRIGARPLMTAGPLVAAVGVLLLLRLDESASYLADVVPAVAVLGLGMSMVVAPLTATVLSDADQEHAGIASGVNNAVAEVAGLVAIAAVGAVVAAQFAGALDDRAAGVATAAVEEAKTRPLTVAEPGSPLRAATEDASVTAFRTGVGVAAGLMLLGGLLSAAGIRDRRRREVPCEECPGGPLVGASEDVARVRVPEPAATPG